MDLFEVDHWRYLRKREYRRVVHGHFLKANNLRSVGTIDVLHESDNRCCTAEPWPTTYQRIIDAITADGAGPVLHVIPQSSKE